MIFYTLQTTIMSLSKSLKGLLSPSKKKVTHCQSDQGQNFPPTAPIIRELLRLKGFITIDIEGKTNFRIYTKIIKKMLKYIFSSISKDHNIPLYPLEFFYPKLKATLIEKFPMIKIGSTKTLQRVTIVTNIDFHTSASSCFPLSYPLKINLNHLWELSDLSEFPLIISYKGDLEASTISIFKRDIWRNEGSSPLGIPSSATLSSKLELTDYPHDI